MKRTIISLLMIIFCTASLAGYPLEIIDLKSRPVSEMIPLIKPFIDQDGSIAGMRNQLIIRTSPKNLSEIKKIIDRLDTPAKRLMIYVRQGSFQNSDRTRHQVDAMVGKNAKVIVGSPTGDNSIRYRVKSASTQSKLDATHRLQAMEGRPAFIQTGQAIPIQEQSTIVSGGVVHQQTTTRYRNATSGFYVTPHINGDQVTLHISPNMDRPGRVHGTFDIQQANTVVRGQLGQWMPIGGVSQRANSTGSGIVRQRSTRSQQNSSMEVLVEQMH